MNHGGDDARACGNGHTNKIFLARASGIGRLRAAGDVEAGQSTGSRHEESKTCNRAQLQDFQAEVRLDRGGQHVKTPHPREQGGSDTEGDDVGEGIKFFAEIALGVGHAGDAAVEAIEKHGKADCHRGEIQMPGFDGSSAGRLNNREESGCDIGGGKQRRQDVHAFAHASAGTVRVATAGIQLFHEEASRSPAPAATGWATGKRARIDAPPWTWSPSLTWMAASESKITSTRDPNLIRPTRWPRATWSPAFRLNTMRRAIRPAICLKITVRPSPSTVTMFCSFCSAELASMAFRNLPRW